ncbi:ImmA/IrrE family metallo-endopeptidase [Cohnella nanjingensis]|uniref:ImmA/IrrE family metallo-endopeptidase n=1 Tax=Cohnella nanjingensis TaxID=1387779 RepID=A0A7X0VDS2_9BACL|nr:ImmA/IrrE family metallo-endopeptidase [Cohnella nanjingensis]MBB6670240.1 ImmA/IrrE family metallo-endopeptidase [Cohnella nanjingensis]
MKRFKTNDPFSISKGLNIQVKFERLGNGTRGFYVRMLRRRFIVIDSDLSADWQRFVCAHELGHDRLHPGINRFFLDEQTLFNAGKYERQANKFAASLLTYGDQPHSGESIHDYYNRHGIPPELHKLLY